MKVIVAGSRTVTDYALVCKAILDSGFAITEVVSGAARGVDSLGERYAVDNSLTIQLFPAEWEKLGKPAGVIRNQKMAEYADALIAVRKDNSRGTSDMIARAYQLGLKVYVMEVP